ncbi:MAG: capsule assembly Wzi family protein [Bacteroidota bacterium]|nr:capsule assembly Wzi family protein [Bacteroidota bacterium]
MHKIRRILILFIFFPILIQAQNDTIQYDVGFMGLASSGNYAPFWLQSNRYGLLSSEPISADLMMGFHKDFGNTKRLFDYGFKANLLLQTSTKSTSVYFHEYYVQARFLVFDFILGAREEHLGNQDSTLSCGGYFFSPNARPIPKITAGIEHFTAVPFTHGYLEIKGAISHGWFTDNIYTTNLWLHHKYLYGRIGGRLPVHFQYGFDHVAQWGGIVPGIGQQPTGFKDFIDIFFARAGGSDALKTDQLNTLGNHIGSQSMKLEVDISDFKISGYWQKVFEDGPIKQMWNAQNRADGLWGLSIRNSKFPFVRGIVFEYLNTTDQSGPYLDKDGIIYGGNDSYFNNGVYQNGWTYYSRTIGTPFITSPLYNSNGAVSIENNRVQVFHAGLEGDVLDYRYKLLSSFSRNYGTYGNPYPKMIENTSMLLEVNKQFPKLSNIEVGCSVGGDFGKLYGNSIGCLFSIRKTGSLFKY